MRVAPWVRPIARPMSAPSTPFAARRSARRSSGATPRGGARPSGVLSLRRQASSALLGFGARDPVLEHGRGPESPAPRDRGVRHDAVEPRPHVVGGPSVACLDEQLEERFLHEVRSRLRVSGHPDQVPLQLVTVPLIGRDHPRFASCPSGFQLDHRSAPAQVPVTAPSQGGPADPMRQDCGRTAVVRSRVASARLRPVHTGRPTARSPRGTRRRRRPGPRHLRTTRRGR